MKRLNKKIHVELLEEASEYFFGLPIKIQEKFLKSFEKTQLGFNPHYLLALRYEAWKANKISDFMSEP